MTQHNGWPFDFGQWLTDFSLNDGIVTVPAWLSQDGAAGGSIPEHAGMTPPVTFRTLLNQPPGPAPASGSAAVSTMSSGDGLTSGINGGAVRFSVTSGAGVASGNQTIISNASTFSGGAATATSASDLNALITAADQQISAGTLTINISGLLALNTLPAVANGETLTIVSNVGTVTKLTAVPDIAAINLHSGVSLVIAGSNNAILDGGNTVRGLFAYAGNVTVNNLTIENTVAQGGSGSNAGFAGGGGAGLGGGLFVGATATVTLNSVSFSTNKAFGGAGGNNTGGGTADWGGGGGLGGNAGIVFGGLYFSGGGGVGRTAFGGVGSSKAVTTTSGSDSTSVPGPGIIVGGASAGNGAPISSGNDPHTTGAINGGGGGISEGTGHNPSFPSPLHYYGAGSGGGGVGGHSGYSKLSPYNGSKTAGGGGKGGFGGGGGAGYYYGGNGGFGGGGGAGQYAYGGNGGFGGGGGGMPATKVGTGKTGKYALGGFGAGNAGGGYNIGNGHTPQYALSGGDSGGGGLGAGGAVFVQSGGVLTLGGAGSVAAGTVVGGAGGTPTGSDGNGAGTAGTAGSAFGSGIFIQNNSTSTAQGVTFAPASGQTLTVSGVIADEKGSGGAGANATMGSLQIKGGGTVRLTGVNTFAGGSSIGGGGTLDLGAIGAGGSGAISFSSGGTGRLLIENAALSAGHLNNTVSAFVGGDAIDLSGLTFKAGATASIVSNTLSVVSNGVTDTMAVGGQGTNLGLVALQDAGTGTEVITTNFSISTEAQLLADLADVNNGGADAAGSVGYTFDFLNAVPLATGGETVNLLSGSSITYSGTGFTTGGTTTITAGELIAGASGALGSGALAIGASGTVSLNGFAQTIGDLSGSGQVLTQAAKLTEGTSNSTTFSGSLTGTGAAALIKQGSGTLALGGTDTLPGGLTINAGGVNLTSGTALNGGGGITFGAGTGDVLEFHASSVPANTIVGFVQGQTLDANLTGTTVTGAAIVNTNTLRLSLSSGGPFNLTMSPAQNWIGSNFNHSISGSDNFVTEGRFSPVVTAGGTVTFGAGGAPVAADPGLTIVDNASATLASAKVVIGGFLTGDTLTVGTPGGLTPGFSGGTLTLTGPASLATYQTALESVDFGFSPVNGDPSAGGTDKARTLSWSVNDGTLGSNTGTSSVHVTCYRRGTTILTDHGGVAVEELRAGELVVTVSGVARPIRWIGHRHLDLARHPAPEQVRPIAIRAGAVADGVPCRDLFVSPDHAILLDGVLILARQLVNGVSIVRDMQCQAVTYYHVELETHDILLAEALPAESYLDTGNRGLFENGGVPLILHPDMDGAQLQRLAGSCRPFVSDAARVEPIWRSLADRASRLGLHPAAPVETTGDPGLHLVMGDRAIEPVSIGGGCYTFVLPGVVGVLPEIDGVPPEVDGVPPEIDGSRAVPVRLVSRGIRQGELSPWIDDQRRLGVAVARLTIRRGTEVSPIPLDHPRLSRGWWDVETDGAALWRWTDGDAVVPLSGTGPAVLEVVLSGSLDYHLGRNVGEEAGAAAGLSGTFRVAA